MAIAYFQGDYRPEEACNVNIKTHAFLYGTSIFEGIRGYWNAEKRSIFLFKAVEHCDRMLENGRMLYLNSQYTTESMVDILTQLIQRNQFESDIYIQPRLYKSGLNVPLPMDQVDTDLAIFAMPFGAYLDLEKGLKVCISNWRRLSDNAIPPRGKISGAYVNSCLMVSDAKQNGYDDAICLTEQGNVSEGSGMNLFFLRKGKLVTPRTSENILEGITRASIITLAQEELGIEVEERIVDRSELYLADEMFFTGTAAQLAPITSVDLRPVGTGKVGEIAKKLQALYINIAQGKQPKYHHWLTEVPVNALQSA
jgi:branched-chain amino acid aminotransferase